MSPGGAPPGWTELPLRGRLLVASTKLGDPNFERTVILVLDHGEEGALGVVLNRPTLVPVDEILDTWAAQASMARPDVIFRGGPVSPDAVIGLARAPATATDAGQWRSVVDAVGIVDLAVPPDAQPMVPEGARLFSGYAGWAADQLEGELAEGAWFVVDALGDDVFCSEPEQLWHDVVRRQRGALKMLATYPPNPSMN
ncbi:MAG TPA: YqgE/AlgH family protein [Acidimicrobiales bacterium]|nr:YqgE/AlgH family protein [Acidimicrobiales bacterium]